MEELLNTPWALEYSRELGRGHVKDIISESLDELRADLRREAAFESPMEAVIEDRVAATLRMRSAPSLKRVVNATGVVIHTNLGRAPLSSEAMQAALSVSGAYSTLEYSPETGTRGQRNSHVEWNLCRLTGAESALVVNNNAAAVLLALSALVSGREVVVSCGELVEIGDSFRIPEILSYSGARMVTVGCTNSTSAEDYRRAVTVNTAAFLKVHPSNYRIEGFVKSAGRAELAALAEELGVISMEDLGSGLIERPDLPFAEREHSVRECLAAGMDIVTFSGDKLLGGPQIGCIAGSKKLIDKIKRHQLLRALRVDKMTLAAFDATLRLYMNGGSGRIPVLKMLNADEGALRKKAFRLSSVIKRAAGGSGITVSVIKTLDAVGGGSYPTDALPGYGVMIRDGGGNADSLARRLRSRDVPVIAGMREDNLVFHVRTLLEGDEKLIAAALTAEKAHIR